MTTHGSAPSPRSLWRMPAMLMLAFYTLFSFTGFFGTVSALPAWVAGQGTADAAAGMVTAMLLGGTVAAQPLAPRMIASWGISTTLVVGLSLLGGPALLLLVDDGYTTMLIVSAVRGAGFGITSVLGSTLTGQIVPPERRGEAVGAYGLAIAIPNLFAVAAGVALVTAGLFEVVVLLGASPLLGLLVARPLGRAVEGDAPRRARGASATQEGRADAGAVAALRGERRVARDAAIAPSVVLMFVTLTSGAFMTYLPILLPTGMLATVSLLVWGAAVSLSRWRAGFLVDRLGPRRLLPWSLVLSIVGINGVAVALARGEGMIAPLVVVASAVLGVGFGAMQNLTLVVAFMRARQRHPATVATVWNVGFNTGTALGSGLVGVLILAVSIPSALALTSVFMIVSLPLAVRSARPVPDQGPPDGPAPYDARHG